VKKLRVGVLYGGRSGEHEVSVASAASIFKHLDRSRYEAVPIRIEKDGRWVLPDRAPLALSAADVIEQARQHAPRLPRAGRDTLVVPHPSEDTLVTIERRPASDDAEGEPDRAVVTGLGLDVVFPVLHGPQGEDGTVQGLLELASVPYVGSGVLASAVGMDKAAMKAVFAAHGLAQTPYAVVSYHEWTRRPDAAAARLGTLGLPVFVKPANLGSSVGISKVKTWDALAPALETAFAFDRKAVVEAAVAEAREIECAILGNDEPEASLPGEVLPAREFYDYQAKYIDAGSQTVVPADLDQATTARVQSLALEAFRAIDAAGMARVDFLLSRATGALLLNEINTIPGFTTISMFAQMWAASGVAYPTLVDRLITLAIERHADKQRLRTSAF
jgi:D-alanine-D-alanine ligase